MPVETEITPSTYSPIRAPRGTAISCKSWQQEAAMRMLMNNLDEEVAERPKDLVVYGGGGRKTFRWRSRGQAGGQRRHGRHGWRSAAGGHHDWRGISGH